MILYLQLVNGKKIEQKLDTNVCIVGRSSKCDVVVPHEGMSRLHCQIEIENGEVYITDLGSTNGVSIDGVRIEPHKKVLYKTYLSLAFGAVQGMQIELDGNEIKEDDSQTDKTIQHRANLTRTITKSMQHRTRPEIVNTLSDLEKKSPAKNHEDKIRMWFLNFVVLMIFGGIIYWYMQNQASNDTEEYELPQENEGQYPSENFETY